MARDTTTPDFPLGPSEASAALRLELAQLAATDTTVLIEGETGTGKGRAATALHGASPRSGGPLVSVHLASLSATLAEAELFGHEEGAFTGAHRAREGRFRQAEGGTLVLDDVHTLARELQGKLLRVLQERAVEPLGSERPLPIDVRVVATCSLDLRGQVERGEFREDLYYRLAVVPVRIPPLRSRLEDLEALWDSLAEQTLDRIEAPPRPLSPEALERLRGHAWPGNVRELENALERVLVMPPAGIEPGSAIGAGEFDFLGESVAGVAETLAQEALAHGIGLQQIEEAVLRRSLDEHRGNISAASRQVGLTRRAFEYRLARSEKSGEGSSPGS